MTLRDFHCPGVVYFSLSIEQQTFSILGPDLSRLVLPAGTTEATDACVDNTWWPEGSERSDSPFQSVFQLGMNCRGVQCCKAAPNSLYCVIFPQHIDLTGRSYHVFSMENQMCPLFLLKLCNHDCVAVCESR